MAAPCIGCFGYKKVKTERASLKKKGAYKIITQGSQAKKGRPHARNDSLVILNHRKGVQYKIRLWEIEEVEVKKFSLGKTMALLSGAMALAVEVAIDAASNWRPAIEW